MLDARAADDDPFASRVCLVAAGAAWAAAAVAGPLMARDREAQLRNLIAGYGDSIRLSDIKANIAVLFVAIMMARSSGFATTTHGT